MLMKKINIIMILILLGIIIYDLILQYRKHNSDSFKQNKLNNWIEQNSKKVCLIILIIGILARVIQLGELPRGLHIDEAGMAYDAYCLAEYGTDRYNNPHPLYLTNFTQGQSAMCAYVTSIFIKLLGLNAFSIRLPMAIFSILTMIMTYLLVKENKNKTIGILVLFILAICPWHIMQARWALDCNLLSSFMAISLYLLVKVKKPLGYLGAGIAIGLTLYTYVLSYLILPVFLFLSMAYFLWIKKISWKNMMIMGVPIFLCAIPLLYMIFLNNGWVPEINSPFFSIPTLRGYRGSEIAIGNIIDNLNIFKILLIGDDMMYNVPKEFGALYYISIPFFVVGLIKIVSNTITAIRKRKWDFDVIVLIQFLSVFICMMIIVEPKVNKANAIYIPMIYMVAIGIIEICQHSGKILAFVFILYTICFGFFIHYYFTQFNNNNNLVYQVYFDDTLVSLTEQLEERFPERTIRMDLRIIRGKNAHYKKEPYIYTLLANKTSPKDFAETIEFSEDDISLLIGYENYDFYSTATVEPDTIYVVFSNDAQYDEKAEKYHFKTEIIGDYKILYQE